MNLFSFLSVVNKVSNLPVALPGVSYVVVCDGVLVGLLVQEVEHVFDSQRQCAASVGGAEDGFKQVIHKFL